jgi:hypothetical protein
MHQRQHLILQNLRAKGLHAGIDENSKVRKFLDSLTPTTLKDAALAAMTQPSMMTNFAATVSFIKTAVATLEARTSITVAPVATQAGNANRSNNSGRNGGRQQKKGNRSGKSNNSNSSLPPIEAHQAEARSYPDAEWRRLTPAAQARVRELRAAKKRRNNQSVNNNQGGGGKRVKFSSNVAAMATDYDGASDEEPVTNRNNPNLTRQPSSRQR